MICMILEKETNNSKEIHAELTECVLHTLSDEKPLLNDLNDYYVVKEMFNKIHSNLLEKSENTSRLLARFQKRNDSVRNLLCIIINLIDFLRIKSKLGEFLKKKTVSKI